MTFMGCLTTLTAFWYLLSHVVSGRARSLKDIMTKVFTFSKLSDSFSYVRIFLASTDFTLEVFLEPRKRMWAQQEHI